MTFAEYVCIHGSSPTSLLINSDEVDDVGMLDTSDVGDVHALVVELLQIIRHDEC